MKILESSNQLQQDVKNKLWQETIGKQQSFTKQQQKYITNSDII